MNRPIFEYSYSWILDSVIIHIHEYRHDPLFIFIFMFRTNTNKLVLFCWFRSDSALTSLWLGLEGAFVMVGAQHTLVEVIFRRSECSMHGRRPWCGRRLRISVSFFSTVQQKLRLICQSPWGSCPRAVYVSAWPARCAVACSVCPSFASHGSLTLMDWCPGDVRICFITWLTLSRWILSAAMALSSLPVLAHPLPHPRNADSEL